jgi:hypothetical protein
MISIKQFLDHTQTGLDEHDASETQSLLLVTVAAYCSALAEMYRDKAASLGNKSERM